MKSQEGQDELKRVLQAIAFALPEVGYCQGMNFIASTIISALKDQEELAFWIFMNLLISRDMKSLYLPVSDQMTINNTYAWLYRESLNCTWRTSRWRSWSSSTCRNCFPISAPFRWPRTTSPANGSWPSSPASSPSSSSHRSSTCS